MWTGAIRRAPRKLSVVPDLLICRSWSNHRSTEILIRLPSWSNCSYFAACFKTKASCLGSVLSVNLQVWSLVLGAPGGLQASSFQAAASSRTQSATFSAHGAKVAKVNMKTAEISLKADPTAPTADNNQASIVLLGLHCVRSADQWSSKPPALSWGCHAINKHHKALFSQT